MRRYLCKIFLKIILLFCCILLCNEVKAGAVAEDRKIAYAVPKEESEKCREAGADHFDDWRYIKVCINGKTDITVDLLIVAGVFVILLLAIFRRE